MGSKMSSTKKSSNNGNNNNNNNNNSKSNNRSKRSNKSSKNKQSKSQSLSRFESSSFSVAASLTVEDQTNISKAITPLGSMEFNVTATSQESEENVVAGVSSNKQQNISNKSNSKVQDPIHDRFVLSEEVHREDSLMPASMITTVTINQKKTLTTLTNIKQQVVSGFGNPVINIKGFVTFIIFIKYNIYI